MKNLLWNTGSPYKYEIKYCGTLENLSNNTETLFCGTLEAPNKTEI